MNLQSRRRLNSTQKKRQPIKLGEHRRSLSSSKSHRPSSRVIEPQEKDIVSAIDNRLQWTYTNMTNNQIQSLCNQNNRFPNDLLTDYINYVYKNYKISDPQNREGNRQFYRSSNSNFTRMTPMNQFTPIKNHEFEYVTNHKSNQFYSPGNQRSEVIQRYNPYSITNSNYNNQSNNRNDNYNYNSNVNSNLNGNLNQPNYRESVYSHRSINYSNNNQSIRRDPVEEINQSRGKTILQQQKLQHQNQSQPLQLSSQLSYQLRQSRETPRVIPMMSRQSSKPQIYSKPIVRGSYNY